MATFDDQKSLLIAFLVISDQYAIFFKITFFYKMAAGGHFDDQKSLLIAFLVILDQYATF